MAKNDPAGLVGGAGLLTKIFTDLNACVVSRGGTANDIHRLTKPEGRVIIEEIADVIVRRSSWIRRVKVNRTRNPQAMLDATKCVQYTDKSVVATMPEGEGDTVEVIFFTPGRFVSDADLAKEYELRGLVPDPYALAAVNEADPAFANRYPNGTHWKLADGGWGFMTFRWASERFVGVERAGDGWDERWLFGGVRKKKALRS